ncbi:hypothetical protein E4V99_13990 [Microbacterium sp. dk485]|uniref:hypothetical protein n=1 Tax=Microbacterium sp. dk485 TaxID=2560021 RepID=UPI001073C798|nr:hypothetical protein [Microbacterium sp. dk485]TFV82040.1 hypothetical protein E4V99_13990 [Microbacterium sp. dk485]
MSSSRERLAALIEPMLPEAWRGRIEKYTVRNIGTLSQPAVFIDYTTMSHEQMPAGALIDGHEIALVSHLTDYAKAEDDLDPTARTLVRGLDTSVEVAWSRAEKRGVGDYLAWIITVQLISTEEQE